MVLTDLGLARGSGLTLVSELRETGLTGRIAVMTSQSAEAYRRACLDAGADEFYDKASGLQSLFAGLAELLSAANDGGIAALKAGWERSAPSSTRNRKRTGLSVPSGPLFVRH